MKKINKIKISRRYLKIRWYVKLFIALLICVLITMIGILIRICFSSGDGSKDNAIPNGNIIADFDDINNNYRIFSNDEGLFGVKDLNDRFVIEACWKNIYFLKDGRFAVEHPETSAIGIIDSDENCITPFIFKKISSVNNDFIAAYFRDESGFALLNTSGDIISDKIWTGHKYDKTSEAVMLTDDTGEYTYKSENGIVSCISINLTGKISGIPVNYTSEKEKSTEKISDERLHTIFSSSCLYISSLISGDTANIRNITNDQFFDSLSSVNLFSNCEIKSIKNLKIISTEKERIGYIFSAEITYDYYDGEKSVTNLRSLVSLNFINDENHAIVLQSMNKEEL